MRVARSERKQLAHVGCNDGIAHGYCRALGVGNVDKTLVDTEIVECDTLYDKINRMRRL